MFNDEGLGEAMEKSWQRDQMQICRREVADLMARVEAFLQQAAVIGAQFRVQALDAALRTSHVESGHEYVTEAARAYEAYLKGE